MLRRVLFLLVGVVVLGPPAGASAEEGCANEASRPAGSYSSRLPDCRAYEQVTPVDKGGTNIQGIENLVQVSPSGERLVFPVLANMPGGEGASISPLFLAQRGVEGWSSRGLTPPFQSNGDSRVKGWSEDLSQTLAIVTEGTSGSGKGLYLRDTSSASLRLVAPIGIYQGVWVAGVSSDDSRVIFETRAHLLPSATEGVINLYEWHNGVVSLAGVLPDGSTSPGGSFAGPYDWHGGSTENGGAEIEYYTQDTISSDGSRVFFTAGETGQLYVRENGVRTVQVSASQRTVPDPNGPKPAAFMAATPNGSRVLFTSCEKLTNDSTAASTSQASCTGSYSQEGQDLYEYNVDSGALADLTVDGNPGDTLGAAVQGVLGVGGDGAYVYFAADGVLAGGASPGNCRPRQLQGTCAVYLWHGGRISFIANLSEFGPLNWLPKSEGGKGHESRVTPSGGTLLFSAEQPLTGYDNQQAPGLTSCSHSGLEADMPCNELYRYDAASAHLTCVSCNPSGVQPAGSTHLRSITVESITEGVSAILARNFSVDGSRVSFESSDALVPQDTNGVQDVYEWELADAGGCRKSSQSFSADSGGCLYLISTGRSPEASYFADAGTDGSDVLFFTDQSLVGQDRDGLVDVYDARVDGGIAAQNPAVSSSCGSEGCRGPAGSAPVSGTPSSAVFSGTGNLTSLSAPSLKDKAKKPKVKRKRHARKRGKAKKAPVRGGSATQKHMHKMRRGSR